MFLSKRSNGTYYVFYKKADGKKTCISTKCKKKQEAFEFLANFQSELKQRLNSRINQISLKSFANEFLKHSESVHRWKTTKDFRNTFNQLIKFFGDIQLNQVGTNQLNQFLQSRGKISAYVSSKDLRYIKSGLNWAVENNYLKENPCKSIKSIKVPEKTPLFMSEVDFECLIRRVDNEDLRDLFIFAVNTGLRQMELLTLNWRQIDFKHQRLTLDNRIHITKSNKPRTIPLSIKALQVLTQRQMKKNSDLIFNMNGNFIKPDYVSKQFKKYAKLTGLNKDLKFHSLRATFGSWLVQRGCNIYDVMRLLGHSDVKVTTRHYASLTNENLRDSINLLNN